MPKSDIIDLSVGEIMFTWPSTIRVFLDRRMHCVGCPIAPFHTLPDAAEEHGLLLAGLVDDIERRIDLEGVKDDLASGHRRSEQGYEDPEPKASVDHPR